MAKKQVVDDGPVKARVIGRTYIDGRLHEPDTVISLPLDAIKALEAQGLVDSDEDAVAYAESLK